MTNFCRKNRHYTDKAHILRNNMRIIWKNLCTGSFSMPFQFQRIVFHTAFHVRCGFISGWIALVQFCLIEIDFPTAYPHLLNEPLFCLVFQSLTGWRCSRFHCSFIYVHALGVFALPLSDVLSFVTQCYTLCGCLHSPVTS